MGVTYEFTSFVTSIVLRGQSVGHERSHRNLYSIIMMDSWDAWDDMDISSPPLSSGGEGEMSVIWEWPVIGGSHEGV